MEEVGCRELKKELKKKTPARILVDSPASVNPRVVSSRTGRLFKTENPRLFKKQKQKDIRTHAWVRRQEEEMDSAAMAVFGKQTGGTAVWAVECRRGTAVEKERGNGWGGGGLCACGGWEGKRSSLS